MFFSENHSPFTFNPWQSFASISDSSFLCQVFGPFFRSTVYPSAPFQCGGHWCFVRWASFGGTVHWKTSKSKKLSQIHNFTGLKTTCKHTQKPQFPFFFYLFFQVATATYRLVRTLICSSEWWRVANHDSEHLDWTNAAGDVLNPFGSVDGLDRLEVWALSQIQCRTMALVSENEHDIKDSRSLWLSLRVVCCGSRMASFGCSKTRVTSNTKMNLHVPVGQDGSLKSVSTHCQNASIPN